MPPSMSMPSALLGCCCCCCQCSCQGCTGCLQRSPDAPYGGVYIHTSLSKIALGHARTLARQQGGPALLGQQNTIHAHVEPSLACGCRLTSDSSPASSSAAAALELPAARACCTLQTRKLDSRGGAYKMCSSLLHLEAMHLLLAHQELSPGHGIS